MACPNCGSEDIWDNNFHWGCNNCKWCSLAGLNPTRTPSGKEDAEARARDWQQRDLAAAKNKN